MKIVKVISLLGLLALAGSAVAGQSTLNQNIARRPLAGQVAEKFDQAWEGASLQANTQKQQSRTLGNLQYLSKRAYMASNE